MVQFDRSTGFLSICQIATPSTALLYAAYKYDNQTRGTLDWGRNVPFLWEPRVSKFQETGIFVE